ncbi:FAD-binding protein [Aestuariibius sp. 2305UL40-4]|uniref:FAD-binding protein n=1 Tax=Aestuariibius violaceus TaxID=3234132 RepID=UPI00345E7624
MSEAEVVEAVRGADGPLRIVGGGTRVFGGSGRELRTGGLSGITLYEPGALTLVAQAGTALAEVEAALAAERQRLAFEPMDHRGLLGAEGEPTIGGVVAAGVSGPRRVQVGACRDFLLGARFVDGSGTALKNGGRVMKNVTGYDLVKLMAGSYGTLGVLTEVSLKVLPAPAAEATLVIEGLEDARAMEALTAALGSPYDVTGAAHLPGRTLVRIEGFAASVDYRAGELATLLDRFGAVTLEREGSAALWRRVRDVEDFHGAPGDVWRISVKPSDGPVVAARLPEGVRVVYDWGGGLVWALVPEGTDLRAEIAPYAGHATLVRGTGAPVFEPQPEGVAALERGLRERFDPKGLFGGVAK